MVVVEFFYRIDTRSLIVRVAREGIDESVDLAYFWYELCLKVSLIGGRTHKKCTELEKVSEECIFAHGRVTDIAVADVHRVL